MYDQEFHFQMICDRAWENRSYLHKIHLFVLLDSSPVLYELPKICYFLLNLYNEVWHDILNINPQLKIIIPSIASFVARSGFVHSVFATHYLEIQTGQPLTLCLL